MLVTDYSLPFAALTSLANPWDGQTPVTLRIRAKRDWSDEDVSALEDALFALWLAGSSGGLSGATFAPEHSSCEQPVVTTQQDLAVATFDPSAMDEKAGACLLSLLVQLHQQVPLKSIEFGTGALQPVQTVQHLDAPYPPKHPALPFSLTIEDSESDVITLEVTWDRALNAGEQSAVADELASFAGALVAGAFGVAPELPGDCGCIPEPEPEWSDESMRWTLEDCRFHPGALDCLANLCAYLAKNVAAIREVIIE